LITDFMGSDGDIFTLRLDILSGRVNRGDCQIRHNCICRAVEGYGDLKPLNTINDRGFLKKLRINN